MQDNPVSRSEYVFAEHDGKKLVGDFTAPQVGDQLPVLVLLHGGGWQSGSSKRWQSWGNSLATKGVASFAVPYRLATKEHPTFTEALWDVQSAIRYLRRHSGQLRIDPNKVGAMGVSAGAHLAAMMALAGDHPKFASPNKEEVENGAVPAKIDVVVGVSGVYDLLSAWEDDQIRQPIDSDTERYIGGTPMNSREKFYDASPIYHASSQNVSGTRWLVAWGTDDNVVNPKRQSKPFVTQLERAGALVRIIPQPGGDHFFSMYSRQGGYGFTDYFVSRFDTFLSLWSGWFASSDSHAKRSSAPQAP